jgi:trimeric autotransporter adhesin
VMGYCNGNWFSDYNLRGVQAFLEARPQTAPSAQAQAAAGSAAKSGGEVLVVSGVIGLDGVRLAPVQAARGEAAPARAGEYLLRLKTAAGGVFDLPFDATLVDHAMPPERHFLVRVPNPGPLVGLELLRGGSVIASRSAPTPPAELARAATLRPLFDAQETAGELLLGWDAARYPYASIVHVGAEGRRVQALDARGGQLRVGTAGLQGGAFELSLSDGLNTQILLIGR